MSDGDNGTMLELEKGREWATEKLAAADKQARWFLTEHPLLALACAVGVGYLAARLLSAKK